MVQIDSLHTTLTVIIALILLVVFVLLGYVCVRFHASRNPVPANFTHNAKLEIIWTLVPVLILVVIAFRPTACSTPWIRRRCRIHLEGDRSSVVLVVQLSTPTSI